MESHFFTAIRSSLFFAQNRFPSKTLICTFYSLFPLILSTRSSNQLLSPVRSFFPFSLYLSPSSSTSSCPRSQGDSSFLSLSLSRRWAPFTRPKDSYSFPHFCFRTYHIHPTRKVFCRTLRPLRSARVIFSSPISPLVLSLIFSRGPLIP